MNWERFSNPLQARAVLEKELAQLRSRPGKRHPVYSWSSESLRAALARKQQYAVEWRERVLALPGIIEEEQVTVFNKFAATSRASYRVFSSGDTVLVVNPKRPNEGVREMNRERYTQWVAELRRTGRLVS